MQDITQKQLFFQLADQVCIDVKALQLAMTKKYCLSGWLRTGIIPFNPMRHEKNFKGTSYNEKEDITNTTFKQDVEKIAKEYQYMPSLHSIVVHTMTLHKKSVTDRNV